MSRARIFLATLTVAQVKAIEATFYLKAYGATQTRTAIISHQNPSQQTHPYNISSLVASRAKAVSTLLLFIGRFSHSASS
jgi:hypothetical protein